ncbi:phthiocerol/phthiodiolone dimycocerosyl transferase family protein [Paraburkholderia azotifigens]|uniref:Phthiocerol/phthiodiolone dimycocerosyl transferase n=1 Tax=Paraburkholderia azotifigens TaxID=2057004 RepID=A0A5C6VGX3_9BURK|nr:condensation protein [Paraburkholderia azotifigens]TXC82598.1 condensation protein [Paraburkholderia azotifigens]
MNSLVEPVMSRTARSLGAMEKFFFLLSKSHPNHFVMAGEVSGSTRVDQWQDALDCVAHHSPLVWSRIERSRDGVPVFAPVPHGVVPLQVKPYGSSNWTDEAAAQVARPFDELNPPLMRATLLHGETRSIIVLVAHHSIGDGLSLTALLGDLLRTMAGQPLERSQQTMAVERLIELTHGVPSADASAPAPAPASADAPDAPVRAPLAMREPDGSPAHVEALRLTSAMTQKLRERARVERTSVQSALVAAFTKAVCALTSDAPRQPMRVLSPVDLRRRLLGGSDHLAMCASGVVHPDDHSRDARLWSRARLAAQAFAGIESPERLAAQVLGAHAMLDTVNGVADAKAVFAQAFGNDAVITNLGVVDLPTRFGALALDAVWGPSVAVGVVGEQVIGAATYRDRLHLVHTSYSPMQGLLDQMVLEIAAALSDVSE